MLDKHSLLKVFIPVSCDDKDTDYEKKKKAKSIFITNKCTESSSRYSRELAQTRKLAECETRLSKKDPNSFLLNSSQRETRSSCDDSC